MVAIADGAPEGHGRCIGDEDFDGETLRLRPDFGADEVHGLFAQALPAPVTDDEELAEINLLGLLPIEDVGDDLPALLEQNRRVLAGQLVPHPLLQLGNGHPIAVSLVTNQLVVEFRERRAVISRGASVGHGSWQASGTWRVNQVKEPTANLRSRWVEWRVLLYGAGDTREERCFAPLSMTTRGIDGAGQFKVPRA